MPHANLTPERGPNVWDRQRSAAHARDTVERALLAGAGLVLLVAGLRGRTAVRRATTTIGAALVALAATPFPLERARAWGDRWRWRRTRGDLVSDQSAQSFPASDSPAWTASTASTGSAPD